MTPTSGINQLSAHDLHLWNEGTHHRAYRMLGAHLRPDGSGADFAVWAPSARSVSVVGDFNDWSPHSLEPTGSSGIWAGFVDGATRGQVYKYSIETPAGQVLEKADPFGFLHETPPATGSRIWDLEYEWDDAAWMDSRADRQRLDAPISVYEVHLGSWMRRPEDGRSLGYREIAPHLVDHLIDKGFTHVELLPIMEHPFYGSWGYQTTGHFAPTSRYGTPQDFMFLVDRLHQAGIGVILDWVPSHFPADAHGLALFDGTHLFEHADPKQGFHPDWHSAIFNYGRSEVASFLISSAMFWLDRYHVDGIRVDAVASMLYLDYSRSEGEWVPNEFGGNENLEAIDFLRRLNEAVYGEYPDIQMIAEESTSWPMVSRPTFLGGLGFGMKWDMGWMHDTLSYIQHEPIHRRYHHHEFTFRMVYAFSENFMLPLSHDEVVHGKGSLIGKMPGDEWQQFANLRLLLGVMWTQPGKKLLFMGSEFAQWSEWNHDAGLDWHLLDGLRHAGVASLVSDLNRVYREVPALHGADCESDGFEWIDANDADASVFTFLRRSRDGDLVVVAVNATPIPRHQYRIGIPETGTWDEILNTDATQYGGSGQGNLGSVESGPLALPRHGRPNSLDLVLPPLSVVALRRRR
ncbi:MAG: 1,4-alpha-glucan branching protein GlgB [Acidimicrobiia bacterium]